MHRAYLPTLALVLLLAACGGDRTDASRGPATWQSEAYGFRFPMPDGLAVRAWAPESLSVGRPSGSDFQRVADIRLYSAGPDVGIANYDAFLLEILQEMCAVEDAGATASCGGAELRQPFATRKGAEGEALYLARSWQGEGERRDDAFGPVFAFPAAQLRPGAAFAVLAVMPPAGLPTAEVRSLTIRRIAEDLQLPGSPVGAGG